MNRSIIVAIFGAAVFVPAGVYVVSPLFTNTTIDEPAPVTGDIMEGEPGTAIAGDEMKDEKATSHKGNDKMMEKDDSIMTEKELEGVFAGAGDGIHNAQGVAKVIRVEGSDVLRLEDLRVTNGPALYVYLATDKQASDFVDLGRLKANNGNQNYDIPEGTDLSKYEMVLVWGKQFSVLFGSAELASGMLA